MTGFPVIVAMKMQNLKFLGDPEFLVGAGVQLLAACEVFVTTNREVQGRKDHAIRDLVRSRLLFVTLRWVALFIVGLLLPYAPVMVLAYVAASVYFELHPPSPELLD